MVRWLVALALASLVFVWAVSAEEEFKDWPPENLSAKERQVLQLVQKLEGSERCQRKLVLDTRRATEHGMLDHSEFPPLQNQCPKGKEHGTRESFSPAKFRIRRELLERPVAVFSWIMHGDPTLALETAKLMMDERLRMKVYFAFHVDASTPQEYHEQVEAFVSSVPDRAVKVKSIDVEWGEISFIDAQMEILKTVYKKWRDWHTVIFLSGADMALGSREAFVNFFETYAGLSYFGSVESVRGKPWPYLLNDMIVSCDNITISAGMRRRLVMDSKITETGTLFMGNTQGFFSREFVQYVLKNKDPNIKLLRKLIRFSASSDEIFWPTLFYNSPLCQYAASLEHDRHFFLYFWPNSDIADPEKPGAECRTAHLQDQPWLCGLRPRWVTPQDLGRLTFYPDTLFVRKVDYGHSKQLVDTVYEWIRQDFRPVPTDIGLRFRLVNKFVCLTLVSEDPPSFQWSQAGCFSKDSILKAVCSGPVEQLAGPSPGQVCMKSMVDELGNPSLCVLSPVRHPRNCLFSRNKEYQPGELVGLGVCHEYREGQSFEFVGCGTLKHAARINRDTFPGGLCLSRTADGSAMVMEECKETLLGGDREVIIVKAEAEKNKK